MKSYLAGAPDGSGVKQSVTGTKTGLPDNIEEDRYDPKVRKLAFWISDDTPGIYFSDVFEIVNLDTGECYQV